jgi:uncharacterized protein with ATP-grasp and redox domains
MRIAPECFPCFFQQIVKTGRVVGAADNDLQRAISEFAAAVPRVAVTATPAEVGGIAYRILAQVTKIADPYREIKRECIRKALALYPAAKERVAASEDKLLAAARAAIAGNVIDFGIVSDEDIFAQLDAAMIQAPAVNHFPEFKRRLAKSQSVLYLADNAGETVFDRVLIEELHKPATYAVRESPIINDAMIADAVQSGLSGIAKLVSSGCALPGIIPRLCSEEFRGMLAAADLIISKGQGNYEGLSDERLPVFFLLKAKCEPVARDLKVNPGALVLMKSRNYFSPRSK